MESVVINPCFRYTEGSFGDGRIVMEMQVTVGIFAGCVALAAILALLSLHILRKEPKYLRERSQNGEILLLTFEQIMALYFAAPEKWDM